jgi:hypothetical protein
VLKRHCFRAFSSADVVVVAQSPHASLIFFVVTFTIYTSDFSLWLDFPRKLVGSCVIQ